MNNKKRILIPLFILIGVCLLGVVYSIIDFKVINKTMSYSYEVIQFDYDGASDGVDPNGNPFNPISFLDDSIIEGALADSGLNYEVSKVKQYIVIENIVPENIVDEITSYVSVVGDNSSVRDITTSDYHSVRYRFVLYRDLDKKISISNLNLLLTKIVDKYCDKFYSTYKKSFETESYTKLYRMENYDYIYQVEVFKSRINILRDISRSIYKKHDDFKSDSKTFNDIALRCDQLISNDVSRINNLITLNALSKDVDRLKEYYNYKIEILTYSRTKYTTDLTNITAQLDAYNKDSTVYVGSGENIVKVESNSNETYNELLSRQIEISNNIASINTEITENQRILDDLNNGVAGDAEYNLVRSYITKLGNDYDALEEVFESMLSEYNDKYITNGTISRTGFEFYSTSFFSTTFVKRVILICTPIGIGALLAIEISFLASSVKKGKRKE